MKKTLSLLLAALMLFGLLAGCSSKPADTTEPADATVNEPADTTPEEPADTNEEPADTTDEPDEPAEEPETPTGSHVAYEDVPPTQLPIVTEPITFKGFGSDANVATKANQLKLEDGHVMQELIKRTGVEWTFDLVASNALTEQYNLMIVSGNWPDLILNGPYATAGGYDKLIDDEVILDLTDLVAEYAPHYQAIIDNDAELRRDLLTDTGMLPGFHQIYPAIQPYFFGYYARADWMNEAGMSKLETFDEWEQFLAWIQAEKGTTGLFINSTTGMSTYLMAGKGAGSGMQYDENGKVYYGPSSEEYKNYLTMITDWYSKGYVDRDFTTNSFFTATADFTDNNIFGIYFHFYTFHDLLNSMGKASNPDFEAVAIPFPVENEGDKLRVSLGLDTRMGGQRSLITTTCEEPEILVQWYDYLYSPEGSHLCTFGVEGDAYNMVDGEIVVADCLANPGDGLGYGDVQALYIMPSMFAHYYQWEREYYVQSDANIECAYVWQDSLDVPNMNSVSPYITLTVEETEDVSSMYTDIQTRVQEYTAKVIIGEASLDEWDSVVEDLYSMGLEDVLEVYQAAFDRYNARLG